MKTRPLHSAANGLTGADAGTTADPDNDGAVNVLEFILNGHPAQPGSRYRIVAGLHSLGGETVLTVACAVRSGATFTAAGPRQTATVDGFRCTVEGSNDGHDWSTVTLSELSAADAAPVVAALPAPDAGGSWHVFRTAGSVTASAPDFVRVRVSTVP